MTAVVDAGLLGDIQKFGGATEISACYDCGVCTAICPLSDNDGTFPRQIIRYARTGQRAKLLSSQELWSCYACGECTKACPTQADPGDFMAAARRYAVAGYDPTGLARRMAGSAAFTALFTTLLVAFFAVFMYSVHGPMPTTRIALFDFVPYTFIHNLGIGVMVLWALAALVGLARMARQLFGGARGAATARPSLSRLVDAVWYAIVQESLGQTRYRDDCTEGSAMPEQPWYLRRWFVHASMMWGFLGLLAATVSDYLLDLSGIKVTGTPVPLWYPIRLLGTAAGLLLMYGTTVVIARRLRRAERPYLKSSVSDWTFLSMLWITGLTGFVVELALYLPPEAAGWAYPMFLLHVSVAMTLVLLMPFSKFAHAMYRPLALVALRLHRVVPAGAPAAQGAGAPIA